VVLHLKTANSSANFIEVTPYIRFSQKNAANILGMSSSELSKRFKEATAGRKWPHRELLKLDNKINKINNRNQSISEIQQQSMDLWIEEKTRTRRKSICKHEEWRFE